MVQDMCGLQEIFNVFGTQGKTPHVIIQLEGHLKKKFLQLYTNI